MWLLVLEFWYNWTGKRPSNVRPHSSLIVLAAYHLLDYNSKTVNPRKTSNRDTSFRLYEMYKLIPVFRFTSKFSLIRAPSSRKPIVVPGASSRKLIFVLRVFAWRAVLEERIKLVNRGIATLYAQVIVRVAFLVATRSARQRQGRARMRSTDC
jgi:hypothetical protein